MDPRDPQSLPPPPPDPNAQPLTYRKYETARQLKQAIGNAQEVLVSATTVFPFVMFPDTITVDRSKLSVAHRSFFRVAEVMSIRMEDVLNIVANVGPFFGSLKIATRFYDDSNKPYEIHFLRRDDALTIKRIVQGYIIALQRKIDCSALSTQELSRLLNELGQGAPDEAV